MTDSHPDPQKVATIQIDLVKTYHASARSELISRIERRDLAMFLFIAAVASIFGAVAPDYDHRAGALLVVPFIGLGAALIHGQHDTLIGAIGLYLGKELFDTTGRIFAALDPGGHSENGRDWDASMTIERTQSHIPIRFFSVSQ